MAAFPAGLLVQEEIERAIDDVEKALAPDLIFVGYSIENDYMGIPSIFFRIVLSDEASRADRLLESGDRVEAFLKHRLQPRLRLGLYPYFDYRSDSEQVALRDPMWETHGVSR